jgi:hypothetical protein
MSVFADGATWPGWRKRNRPTLGADFAVGFPIEKKSPSGEGPICLGSLVV